MSQNSRLYCILICSLVASLSACGDSGGTAAGGTAGSIASSVVDRITNSEAGVAIRTVAAKTHTAAVNGGTASTGLNAVGNNSATNVSTHIATPTPGGTTAGTTASAGTTTPAGAPPPPAAASTTPPGTTTPPGGTTTPPTGQTNAPATVALSSSSFTVNVLAGQAVVTVERTDAGTANTMIGYKTADATAVAGVDYSAVSGSLSWAAGDRSVKKILVGVTTKASGKLFDVKLVPVSGGASISGPATAAVSITAPSLDIPAAAIAAGYLTQTFGPQVTMGVNWFDDNFYGPSKHATQNSDGTVSITAQGVASATRDTSMPNKWRGMAFGGGVYVEAVMHFANADDSVLKPNWPAFWGCDIENMSQNAVTASTQWEGQPEGFGNWIETDFFEYDHQNVNEYGIQIHDWYGYHNHQQVQDVMAYTQGVKVANGFNWSESHKYGWLWVPATATTKGYAMGFMDGVQMGPTIYWNQYDPHAPPPPKVGTTAFSVLDSRHLVLIVETGPHNPLTLESVTVWQASDSENLTQ